WEAASPAFSRSTSPRERWAEPCTTFPLGFSAPLWSRGFPKAPMSHASPSPAPCSSPGSGRGESGRLSSRWPPDLQPTFSSRSHKELGQVLRRVVKGFELPRRYRIKSFVALAGRFGQRLVGPVAHVEKTDVVVFSVETAEGRLVIKGEVVRADAPRICGGIFQVHPKRPPAVGLALHPADAAGRQPRVQSAKVPLPDHDREVELPADQIERLVGDLFSVAVEAKDVKVAHARQRPWGRHGVIPDAQVEVVGVN